MSQQGPILVISTSGRPSFAAALDEAKLFPVIDTNWAEASRAVEQLRPAAANHTVNLKIADLMALAAKNGNQDKEGGSGPRLATAP